MPQTLRREPADHFTTRQVCLSKDGNISATGKALSFAEVQQLRSAGEIQQTDAGQVFANLGVSLELVIQHQGRRALALVEQAGVLKLVSGYVPDTQLASPLTTAWAELMEEVLPFTERGCYGYSLPEQPLNDPYQMNRCGTLPISTSKFIGNLKPRNLSCDQQPLGWPVSSYIHQQTASLQLVFPVTVTLPDDVTLLHVEDSFQPDTNELVSELHPQAFVVLMELDAHNKPTGELATLQKGSWHSFTSENLTFSEYFTATSFSEGSQESDRE